SGEVRYDGRASHQKAQLKVFLQGYGEVVLNLYDVPKQVLGIRVEVQLKGEARGSEGQGGAGTWLSLEGEDAWSEPFQVPAVVSFQINIYSRAGLWLGHTESASVLPQHSLTLSHSLVNVPMIKFNFFSSGKGEWAEIDMTILKADEHPTPLSTQYLQLPGSLLLPGSLGGDDQLLATCDGFAPAMGNRLAEVENSLITELEFLLFPSAILRLDGITSQTSGDLILSSWAAIGPFDLKSFNIKVTLEDGVIEARNFGHLTEGLQVGNIYMPIDVDDGEILALFGWPPSKSKILSDEKFIVRGLPEEILRVKISIVQNGVTLDSSFCTDFSQEGSNTFATLLTIPQEEVSVYIQFMSRAIGAEWLFFDPIQISPESVVEAQGLTLQRTHYE
ncbi:MAG: hypothetical protein HOE66_10100, partial [Planctomycetes bacterium]|nr:hypothetical protein [Planctomycetota bacterium]